MYVLSRTVSKLLQIIGQIRAFEAPFGGLGATYDVHLRLTGKLVGDFLLVIIRQADVVGRLKLYCCTFFFYQSIFLSSGADDAHQIYTRGSVLGEALTRNSEISHTPPLILQGGVKKC